jgi:hypothetical protein
MLKGGGLRDHGPRDYGTTGLWDHSEKLKLGKQKAEITKSKADILKSGGRKTEGRWQMAWQGAETIRANAEKLKECSTAELERSCEPGLWTVSCFNDCDI